MRDNAVICDTNHTGAAAPVLKTTRASSAFRRRWLPATCTGYGTTRRVGRGHHGTSRAVVPGLATRVPPLVSLRPHSGARSIAQEPLLTLRQYEVAALIAQGLTNRQIANRLVIAPRTADNHVQHIFDKLGLSSRAQVAAWVARRGMLP